MKNAVFLDRDGVINKSIIVNGLPKPPVNIEDVKILEGVVEAIKILKDNDLVPVVVTNQPDAARRITSQERINAINAYVGSATDIEFFYTCFHDDNDCCNCRKPSPGLIYQAATELNLNIYGSFMVGDRWRDIAASQAAGCEAFFIDRSYSEILPNMPYSRVDSLLEATYLIIGKLHGSSN
jgi:D-glycero-D-manno-heptose 1,7-bisphosphate phosphatase